MVSSNGPLDSGTSSLRPNAIVPPTLRLTPFRLSGSPSCSSPRSSNRYGRDFLRGHMRYDHIRPILLSPRTDLLVIATSSSISSSGQRGSHFPRGARAGREHSAREHRARRRSNVANNLAAIGCEVTMMGIIGADDHGKILRDEFRDNAFTMMRCSSISRALRPRKRASLRGVNTWFASTTKIPARFRRTAGPDHRLSRQECVEIQRHRRFRLSEGRIDGCGSTRRAEPCEEKRHQDHVDPNGRIFPPIAKPASSNQSQGSRSRCWQGAQNCRGNVASSERNPGNDSAETCLSRAAKTHAARRPEWT